MKKITDPNILKYLDPNQQYSGGPSNKKYHEIVQNVFGHEYNGTIIDETQLNGNYKYTIEDLDGPSEIVIWNDHNNLLEEVINGGKKRKIYKQIYKTKSKYKQINKTKRKYKQINKTKRKGKK